MHFIKLYQPLIGTKASFLQSFQGDTMRNNASSFWGNLDDVSIVFFILTIVAAIGVVVYYYMPFNNQPGRHYLPKYWWRFLAVSAILGFVITIGIAMGFATPKLNGTLMIELKVALANAVLAVVAYCFFSWWWCKWGKTNAYRYLKCKYL